MKRLAATLVLLVVAIVVVAIVVIAWAVAPLDATAPGSSTPPASTSDTATGIPSRPPDAFPMTVESVWDGDTLRATVVEPNDLVGTSDEVRIRLIGVDTPELGEECWADEARDALGALAPPGATVWVAPDADPFDRYGRLLLYVWTEDGRFVNLELAAAGDAEAIRIEPNSAHFDLLASAEGEARAAGAGQWGACG